MPDNPFEKMLGADWESIVRGAIEGRDPAMRAAAAAREAEQMTPVFIPTDDDLGEHPRKVAVREELRARGIYGPMKAHAASARLGVEASKFTSLLKHAAESLPDDFKQAYLATEFRVSDNGQQFTLRIAEQSAAMAALYREHDANTACFITACNPRSESLEAAANKLRTQKLIETVQDLSLPFYHGEGADPSGQWPPEESLLVLGISCGDAFTLGERFEQNAVVWVAENAVPRLMVTLVEGSQ